MPATGNAPSPTSLPIGFPKASSVDQINTFVAQNEVVGPLTDMGNDGTQSVFVFETALPTPTTNAVIHEDNQAGTPSGALVCKGKIFVSGTLTDASAYR